MKQLLTVCISHNIRCLFAAIALLCGVNMAQAEEVKYKVSWMCNKDLIYTDSVASGSSMPTPPEVPATLENCPDKHFIGWTTQQQEVFPESNFLPAPFYRKSNPNFPEVYANFTFRAVYADVNDDDIKWVPLSEENPFEEGVYMIVATEVEVACAGKTQGADFGNGTPITINGDRSITDKGYAIEVKIEGTAESFSIFDGEKYVSALDPIENFGFHFSDDAVSNWFLDGVLISESVNWKYVQYDLERNQFICAESFNWEKTTLYKRISNATNFITYCSESYNVKVNVDPNGAGSAFVDEETVKKGSTTTITATAIDGYTFAGWSFESDNDASIADATNPTTTLTMGHSDVTVTAHFVEGYGCGKTFVGWATQEIKGMGEQDEEPEGFTTTYIEDGVPVFAKKTDAEPSLYTLVTSDESDWADKYVIVAPENNNAMSSNQVSEGCFGSIEVNISGNQIYSPDEDIIWQFEQKTDNTYLFRNGDSYLGLNSNDNLTLTLTNGEEFLIKDTDSDIYQILATSISTRNGIRYEKSTSVFTLGSSRSSSLRLFKCTRDAVPASISGYCTSFPCNAPETALAINGENSGQLYGDGTPCTKTLTISGGNGNENITWSVDSENATITTDGVFSTLVAGTYTITAEQERNIAECLCPQTATFEIVVEIVENDKVDIVYWGAYDNGKVGITLNLDNTNVTGTVSINNKIISTGSGKNTDGTFTIEMPLETIKEYACEYVNIVTKQGGTTVIVSARVKVPIIVDGKVTTADERFSKHGAEVCKDCDVVVLDGATLTKAAPGTTNDIIQVRDLQIYPGGTFILSQDKKFTVNNFVMRSKADIVPSAYIQGTLNYTKFYHSKRIDGARYYFFTLPYDCEMSDITYADGSPLSVQGMDYALEYYNGEERVLSDDPNGGDFWNPVPVDGTLVRGIGYILAINAEIESDFVNNQKKEVLFPIDIAFRENAPKGVNVYPYGLINPPKLGNNHKGWNLIGNPYLSKYGNIPIGGLKLGTYENGYYDENGVFTYADSSIPYLTMPNEDGLTYTQVRASEQDLKPFLSFFVQVETNGLVRFIGGDRINPEANLRAAAPRSVASLDAATWVKLTLSKGELSDATTIIVDDSRTTAYEIGADLEKMLGYAALPQFYSLQSGMRLAFNALSSDVAASAIPLGFYAPTNDTYTISLNSAPSPYLEGVYLTDNVTGSTTNLLYDDYTFTSARTSNDKRFSVAVVRSVTAVDNVLATDVAAYVSNRELHINNAPVGSKLYVFDTLGREVIDEEITTATLQYNLPMAGVYHIQIVSESAKSVYKVVCY